MRCPECGNFCMFSFMDHRTQEAVYQCGTTRVDIPLRDEHGQETGRFTHTLDHSDHFYLASGQRVVPVKAGDVWVARGYKEAAR